MPKGKKKSKKRAKAPKTNPAPERLLYEQAVAITGMPMLDLKKGEVVHAAYNLLMRTYMAVADLAGDYVTIKVRHNHKKKG